MERFRMSLMEENRERVCHDVAVYGGREKPFLRISRKIRPEGHSSPP